MSESARRLHLMSGLIMLGTFLAGGVAGAGLYATLKPEHGPGRGGPRRGPQFLEELDLTADQQTKAKAIFEKHHTAVEAVMSESFPKVRAINDAMDEELKAILTPAQVTKFEELKKRRPRPGERGFGPGGPGGPFGGPPHGPSPDGPPPGEPPPGEGAPPK